jgi:ornithine cyclodeaminase/alanine dehydrogenase-like protein (mu-crystallin family)
MLTGKPQARFGFDISLYESVEVLVDIHPLVQYAHHINQVGAGNSVVQRVRSNSVLTLEVVKDEWVGAGQTILPCDLNTFWDPRTTKRADKFIVDSIDEHELFAKMGYFPDGLPTIVAETGEVLADVVAGRENPDQLIVNSNIGMEVCDVVVGKAIYDRALAQNAGTTLGL